MEKFTHHETAVIDPGATIGVKTHIWHFCHIMPGAVIGRACNLGQNVFIDNNVTIGDRVKIQNHVSVYNGVVLEDEVFVGPSVVFTNVVNPRSAIDRKSEFKPTIVRKGATLGANATILCGIEIGEYAMIGAGALVTKNVAPYAVMKGNPARQSGWMSQAGARLDFTNSETASCAVSRKIYRLSHGRVLPVN